jgi:sodium/proline symporter
MGFGCSFGPLVLLALHSTYINKYGAYISIFTGSLVAALWHILGNQFFLLHYGFNIPAVVPGFIINIVSAYTTTWLTKD